MYDLLGQSRFGRRYSSRRSDFDFFSADRNRLMPCPPSVSRLLDRHARSVSGDNSFAIKMFSHYAHRASAFSLAHLEIAIPGRQCVREQPDEIIRRRPKAVVSNLFRSVVRNSQNIASVRNQGRKTRQKALPLGTQLLGRRVRQKRMSGVGTEARG